MEKRKGETDANRPSFPVRPNRGKKDQVPWSTCRGGRGKGKGAVLVCGWRPTKGGNIRSIRKGSSKSIRPTKEKKRGRGKGISGPGVRKKREGGQGFRPTPPLERSKGRVGLLTREIERRGGGKKKGASLIILTQPREKKKGRGSKPFLLEPAWGEKKERNRHYLSPPEEPNPPSAKKGKGRGEAPARKGNWGPLVEKETGEKRPFIGVGLRGGKGGERELETVPHNE